MTLVADSSVVVAALVATGDDGTWATSLLASQPIAAPHLMPVEVANVLRRAAHAGNISHDVASLAHGDLLQLRFELFSYEPFAERVWDLRENLTAHDGWYVALAEALGVPLATLDDRLVRARGPRCEFVTPSTGS